MSNLKKRREREKELLKEIEGIKDDELGAPPNFDPEMYNQPESEGGDPKNMNMGGLGECKGSKAIRGKGFKGVF